MNCCKFVEVKTENGTEYVYDCDQVKRESVGDNQKKDIARLAFEDIFPLHELGEDQAENEPIFSWHEITETVLEYGLCLLDDIVRAKARVGMSMLMTASVSEEVEGIQERYHRTADVAVERLIAVLELSEMLSELYQTKTVVVTRGDEGRTQYRRLKRKEVA